ncbi:MAG: ribose-phosphate pyrophosphokinase [Exilibacterium sp.]
MNEIALFSLVAGRELTARVASHLGVELGRQEERHFEDGEHKIRPLQTVRGRDVYLLQSLCSDSHSSVDAKLVRVLFFLGALRDAGAARVTAVVPYLCYARKDRRTKPRDPLSLRYLAQLFEAVGVDRVVALDVHNLAAFQNAFRCATDHLTLQSLLLDYFAGVFIDAPAGGITVASPDVGGIKRAESFRQALGRWLGVDISSAFMEKYRSGGRISGSLVVGEVQGRSVIIIDDLIAGGTTMVRAADAFLEQGAQQVYAVATHGVFAAGAAATLSASSLTRVVISNSLPVSGTVVKALADKLVVIDLAPLLAEAIDSMHEGGSLVDLSF